MIQLSDVMVALKVLGIGASPPITPPDAAFFAGRKGYAFDFRDATTLFQLNNGTVPVTANNDPIGYVTDLSGNGNHATSTLTERPIYNLERAEFDGVNDKLTTPAIDLSATDKLNIFFSATRGTGVTEINQGLLGSGAITAGNFYVGWFSDRWRSSLYGSSGNSQVYYLQSLALLEMLSLALNIAGANALAENIWRKNGNPIDNTIASAGPAGSGNFSNSAHIVGNANASFFAGELYRMIVISGTLTETERYIAENWCASSVNIPIPF